MVCCVLVALLFALPVVLARALTDIFKGAGQCTMGWRLNETPVVAGSMPGPDPTFAKESQFVARAAKSQTQTRSLAVKTAFVPNPRFSLAGRLRSFVYAGRGALRLLSHEHSAWIQMCFALVALLAGVVLNISAGDWRWIILMVGLVLTIEGLNTAIESTCDRISLEYSEQIKIAKDVAAGAVLLSSMTAAIIGVVTFLPYLTVPSSVHIPVLDCLNGLKPQQITLIGEAG